MNYNDEQILNIEDYEKMAKAYADSLKQKGYSFNHINKDEENILINNIFDLLFDIKNHLLMLGGYMNTAHFYSINERQIKAFQENFHLKSTFKQRYIKLNKPYCFFKFIGLEFTLLQKLLILQTSYQNELEIDNFINCRLAELSKIFK